VKFAFNGPWNAMAKTRLMTEFWMGEEDDHYQRDPTRERSNVVIDGTT
jgi:hypothetical protein